MPRGWGALAVWLGISQVPSRRCFPPGWVFLPARFSLRAPRLGLGFSVTRVCVWCWSSGVLWGWGGPRPAWGLRRVCVSRVHCYVQVCLCLEQGWGTAGSVFYFPFSVCLLYHPQEGIPFPQAAFAFFASLLLHRRDSCRPQVKGEAGTDPRFPVPRPQAGCRILVAIPARSCFVAGFGLAGSGIACRMLAAESGPLFISRGVVLSLSPSAMEASARISMGCCRSPRVAAGVGATPGDGVPRGRYGQPGWGRGATRSAEPGAGLLRTTGLAMVLLSGASVSPLLRPVPSPSRGWL